MTTNRPVVLVSWNGRNAPLDHIHLDAAAQFDWVLFDYSGRGAQPGLPDGVVASVLSQATECKGELYRALVAHVAARAYVPAFVALIDDDVILSVSDINRLLHLGRVTGLHAFSAALTHDSHRSHRWMLQRTRNLIRPVDWVEVMMPFYAGELFLALAPHLGDNISSWGVDRYLVPTVQQVTGLDRCAVVDAVVASHRRPVSSGQRTFRNGKTAAQESALLKQHCIAWLQAQRPELVGTAWWRRIFVQRHPQTRWTMALEGLGRPLRRWLDRST
jgi:hypothetical protein